MRARRAQMFAFAIKEIGANQR
jgi:hypothetical protein